MTAREPNRPNTALDALIDIERYPLDDPASDRLDQIRRQARSDLHERGCAVLPDLVRPETVAALHDEILAAKPTTHYSTQVMNPYFHTTPDPAFADHHPVNTFLERSSGFIPGDSWNGAGVMTALFRSPELAAFLAQCLEIPELHCYADPLAGLTANVLDPGQQFTWHFDTNEFAVTVLVDRATTGGAFQYVPNIRSAGDEGFERIQAVLDAGDDLTDLPGLHTLDLRPGDLQIFRGRFSLHRVQRVAPSSAPRHAAIFAYTREPGVIGRLERTCQLFGRVLPVHEEAERARVRSDALID